MAAYDDIGMIFLWRPFVFWRFFFPVVLHIEKTKYVPGADCHIDNTHSRQTVLVAAGKPHIASIELYAVLMEAPPAAPSAPALL